METTEYSIDQARELLSLHAADWAHLPVREVVSTGTDNALFLLGEDHVLRIAKRAEAVSLLAKELTWLPRFGDLPLAVPEVVFRGDIREEHGCEFGILRWLKGEIASPDRISDRREAAIALADFLLALHEVGTDRAPLASPRTGNRGVALATLSQKVSGCIGILSDEIAADRARAMWSCACSALANVRPVWIHGDLKADNLIVRDGQLSGVIDWGLSAVGDPAADYAVAWSWIDPAERELFRERCRIDADTWNRARGWALYGAVIALGFYRGRSHEPLCALSRRTLDRLGLCR